METKANYLMIGGFVLGVLALVFIFIYWMSNFSGGGKRYTIVFESSVAGLTTGSSVGFNGIRVGEVQSFSLDPEDARKVNVLVSLRDDTPVSRRLWPPLTTVRWPIHDMGRAAAQHLLRAAGDQPPARDSAVFPAFLVERESTAAAPK